jgi:monoamine oxidase
MPSDPEVLVIGAGAAGIAAARALIAAGRSCLVLEGGARIGGRAATSHAFGAPLDLGATWLHQAGDNPLARFAPDAVNHDLVRERHLHLGDRFATPAELDDYEAALVAFEERLAQSLAAGGLDRSVAEAAPRGGRWDATIAHWLGAQINAAELDRISLEDFLRTDLAGPNLLPREGVGGLVARLAEGLPIRLGARVERLRWDGPGLVAEGDFGTLRSRSAIVTVSTGVLAAGGIRFVPELPVAQWDAIHGLPMGLLTKLGFRASGVERLGMAPFHSARRAPREGEAPPFGWVFWPYGHDHLFGFIGGARAWDLAKAGEAALEAAAREDLSAIFGSRAAAALGAMLSEDWAGNPLFRGSYTHARPGCHAARARLAEPLGGGRLCFAGEACHSTVAGAWLSGEAAARNAR